MALSAVATFGPSALAAGAPEGRPSPFERDLLRPMRLTLYGLASGGLVRADLPGQRSVVGIGPLERTRLGFRTSEVLDKGIEATARLEVSPRDPCAPDAADTPSGLGSACTSWFAHFSVGLADRAWGRIEAGLIDHAASALTVRADPWSGSGALSALDRSHLLRVRVDPERHEVSRPLGLRSTGLLSVGSPSDWPVKLALQWGRPQEAEGRHERGMVLAWDRRPWLVGMGWHGDRLGWTRPVVVQHDDGVSQMSISWSEGRAAEGAGQVGGRYRNWFVGGVVRQMSRGLPDRVQWRWGLNRHRFSADAGHVQASDVDVLSDTKAAVGVSYLLSRRATLSAGVARVRPDQGEARTAFELGLTYAFERDLRLSQLRP